MHFFPLAQANEYTFKHITSANGLPQNYVRSVIQDSRGFMWFTTFDGIVRYDGYSFKTPCRGRHRSINKRAPEALLQHIRKNAPQESGAWAAWFLPGPEYWPAQIPP